MPNNRFLRHQAQRGLSPMQHARAYRFSGSPEHYRLYCAQDEIYAGYDGNGYPVTGTTGQSDDGVPVGYRRAIRGYNARRYGFTIKGSASGKAGGSWKWGAGGKGSASGEASASATGGASGSGSGSSRPDVGPQGPQPRSGTPTTRQGITGQIVPVRIAEPKDLPAINATIKLLGPDAKTKPSPTLPPAPEDLPAEFLGCVQEDGGFLRTRDPLNPHHGMQLQNIRYSEVDGMKMATFEFSRDVGDQTVKQDVTLPVCSDGTRKEEVPEDCCVELIGNGGGKLKTCGSYDGLVVSIRGERDDNGVPVADAIHPDLPDGRIQGIPICVSVEEQPEDKPCCINEEDLTLVCPEGSPYYALHGMTIPPEYCDYTEDDNGRKVCNIRCPEQPRNDFESALKQICDQFGGAKFAVCEPEDPWHITPHFKPKPQNPCFNPETGMLENPDGSSIPVVAVLSQDDVSATVTFEDGRGRNNITVPLCPVTPPPPQLELPPEYPPDVPGREPPPEKTPPEKKPCPEKVPEACCFDHETSSIVCEGTRYHGLVVNLVEEVVLENGQRVVAVEHPSLPGGGMRMTYCVEPPEVDIYDEPVEEPEPEAEEPEVEVLPEPPPPSRNLPNHCCWSLAEQRIKCEGTNLDGLKARVLVTGIVKNGYPMIKVQHRVLPGGTATIPLCPTECMTPTQELPQQYRGYNYVSSIADMPGNMIVANREVEYPGMRGATGREFSGVGTNVGYRGMSRVPGMRGAGQEGGLRKRRLKPKKDGGTLFCKSKNNVKRCHLVLGAVECYFDRAGRAWCCWQDKCIGSDEIILPGVASLALDSMHNEHKIKLNRRDSVTLFKAVRSAIRAASHDEMTKESSKRRYGMTRIGKDRRASRYNWQPSLSSIQGMHSRIERGRVGMEFPPNISGRVDGYNTKMFRSAADLGRVLRSLGYDGMEQDMTRRFQTHWNFISQRVATSRDFENIPMYRIPKGNLVADGRPGPLTLNAIEAAVEIQNAGVPWDALVNIAENPAAVPRRKLYSAFLGE